MRVSPGMEEMGRCLLKRGRGMLMRFRAYKARGGRRLGGGASRVGRELGTVRFDAPWMTVGGVRVIVRRGIGVAGL